MKDQSNLNVALDLFNRGYSVFPFSGLYKDGFRFPKATDEASPKIIHAITSEEQLVDAFSRHHLEDIAVVVGAPRLVLASKLENSGRQLLRYGQQLKGFAKSEPDLGKGLLGAINSSLPTPLSDSDLQFVLSHIWSEAGGIER